MWAILVDKGYQGLKEELRAVLPKKKPHRRLLSREEEDRNKRVSSDRIIVERWFGRLSQLWSATSNQYRWSESSYNTIFAICAYLTNVHCQVHLLTQQDSEYYEEVLKKMVCIAFKKKERKCRAQASYRQRKKRALVALREIEGTFEDEEEDETQPPLGL